MGELDQHAKSIFKDETHQITGGAASFEVPAETRLHEVRADGLITFKETTPLTALAEPWCLAREDEVVIELKMQGDKTDRAKFDRGLLRRQAREVQRREQQGRGWTAEMPLWFVAPHLPRWLSKVRDLTLVAKGVYRVEPYPFQFLWISGNRLPLKPELIPFLITRTDNRLLEFAKWVIDHRPVGWLEQFIEVTPMTSTQMEELLKYMPETDDPKRLRRRKMFTELLYKTHPHWFDPVLTREAEKLAAVRAEELAAARAEEIASDKVKEERLQGVFEFYSLRLGRDLTDDDKTTLAERFERLGGERVRAAVFAFEPSGLEAWLADPEAM